MINKFIQEKEAEKLKEEWKLEVFKLTFGIPELVHIEPIADWWLKKLESSLLQYNTLMVERVEGMRMKQKFTEDFPEDNYATSTVHQWREKMIGYNQAVDDILNLLKN